jgi:DNA uptake protein ComE-like DNA-binding protein
MVRDGVRHSVPSRTQRLEVNAADSLAWIGLPGIGPGWASRILRFRRSLGGFASVAQIAETYGLPDSVFLTVLPYLYVDTSRSIATIDINRATAEQLAAHPYLTYRVARAVVAYRERHGIFGRLEDLGRVALVSPELLDRLRPYLRWE